VFHAIVVSTLLYFFAEILFDVQISPLREIPRKMIRTMVGRKERLQDFRLKQSLDEVDGRIYQIEQLTPTYGPCALVSVHPSLV